MRRHFLGFPGWATLYSPAPGRYHETVRWANALAKGKPFDEIKSSMTAIAEGVATSLSVHRLAEKHGVTMPISNEVL